MFRIFNYPIKKATLFFEKLGEYLILLFQVFRSIDAWPSYIPNTIDQMIIIGSRSIPIVILTSFSSGMVTSVQGAYQMTTTLVPKWYLGGIVGNGVLLELAPLITGLVLAGRVGANIAAEIGTMRVTEQIDALETLSLDPVGYLLFPRIIAGTLMFPVLVVIADLFGILGGLITCITTLDMNVYQFLKGLRSWFNPWDAFFGYFTKGGAEGVGKATTSTVVVSCVSILILDYFLAEILL